MKELIKPDDTIGQWAEREIIIPEVKGKLTELYFVTKTGKETLGGLIKVELNFLEVFRDSFPAAELLMKSKKMDELERIINMNTKENKQLYYTNDAYFNLKKSKTWYGKFDKWKRRKNRLYYDWMQAYYSKLIEEKNKFNIDTIYIGLAEECWAYTHPKDFKAEPYLDKFAGNVERMYKDSRTSLASIYEYGL